MFINIFKIILHNFWKEICKFYYYLDYIILALLLLDDLSMDMSMHIELPYLLISEMLFIKLEEGSDPAVITPVIPVTTHICISRDRCRNMELMNIFQAILTAQNNRITVHMEVDKIYHKVRYQVLQMQ